MLTVSLIAIAVFALSRYIAHRMREKEWLGGAMFFTVIGILLALLVVLKLSEPYRTSTWEKVSETSLLQVTTSKETSGSFIFFDVDSYVHWLEVTPEGGMPGVTYYDKDVRISLEKRSDATLEIRQRFEHCPAELSPWLTCFIIPETYPDEMYIFHVPEGSIDLGSYNLDLP